MLLGYNTNGFAHHRLEDALSILADLGYESVALTLDWHALNPLAPDWRQQAEHIRGILAKKQLRSVVETGARFLLDPRRKHQPTLISPLPEERQRRVDFLIRAVDIAAVLNADAVSFWSGAQVDLPGEAALWQRLIDGCQRLSDYAANAEVRLAFEPEPGMFIDTMPQFAELRRRVAHANFGLTLDIGHLHCQGETPIAEHIRKWRDVLWNVHIEDMRKGVHEHLKFGEGEIEFEPVLAALNQVGYGGCVHVELSRHSHDAVNTARRARDFLMPYLKKSV